MICPACLPCCTGSSVLARTSGVWSEALDAVGPGRAVCSRRGGSPGAHRSTTVVPWRRGGGERGSLRAECTASGGPCETSRALGPGSSPAPPDSDRPLGVSDSGLTKPAPTGGALQGLGGALAGHPAGAEAAAGAEASAPSASSSPPPLRLLASAPPPSGQAPGPPPPGARPPRPRPRGRDGRAGVDQRRGAGEDAGIPVPEAVPVRGSRTWPLGGRARPGRGPAVGAGEERRAADPAAGPQPGGLRPAAEPARAEAQLRRPPSWRWSRRRTRARGRW